MHVAFAEKRFPALGIFVFTLVGAGHAVSPQKLIGAAQISEPPQRRSDGSDTPPRPHQARSWTQFGT
jgi:hypothetical protein